MFFAVLRKVDPIDNHTLELNCERYPKRVLQKHLAQRDDTVDKGNIQCCTELDLSRLVYRRISQTFAGFLPQYFPWAASLRIARKYVHVRTYILIYDVYMSCTYCGNILKNGQLT